jgi:hypothetical protein
VPFWKAFAEDMHFELGKCGLCFIYKEIGVFYVVVVVENSADRLVP